MIERRGRGYSTHSTRDPVSPSRQSFAAVPNSSGLAASCTCPVWAQRTRVLFADAAKREERFASHTTGASRRSPFVYGATEDRGEGTQSGFEPDRHDTHALPTTHHTTHPRHAISYDAHAICDPCSSRREEREERCGLQQSQGSMGVGGRRMGCGGESDVCVK